VQRAIRNAVLALWFFISLLLVACSEEPDTPDHAREDAPEGVRSFEISDDRHTEEPVSYPQSPPVGGPHDPLWQNCGYYSEPVREETAVHSLEHGAVWITYRPDLPQDEIGRIRDLAQSESYVLASPYEDQSSPVVATAWGKQLTLESAEDPGLERFVNAYSQGPQTPEPGATCTGGFGDPA